MPIPYTSQMRKDAMLIANAERIQLENKILRSGLKLSDADLQKAKELAELAFKSGAPFRFLGAVTVIFETSTFVPMQCRCWWCRLRRWYRKWERKLIHNG